jgi:hypothetical protein
MTRVRIGLLTLGILSIASPVLSADRQIKPFVAVTFRGSTTFVDFEHAAGKPSVVMGIGAVVLGEILGLDVDVAHAPGFFQAGDQHLVLSSGVTTATGNVVVTFPRRMTEYTLRPYFVAGAGLMHVHIEHPLDVLELSDTLAATDVGGGATGFVTNRIGLSWDVRRFRSFSRSPQSRGVSIGPEQLIFWRASMGLAIRY